MRSFLTGLFALFLSTQVLAHHANVFHQPNEVPYSLSPANLIHFASADSYRWRVRLGGMVKYDDDPFVLGEWVAKFIRGTYYNDHGVCSYTAPMVCSPNGPSWAQTGEWFDVLDQGFGALPLFADFNDHRKGQFQWITDISRRPRTGTCNEIHITQDFNDDLYVHIFNWMPEFGNPTMHLDNADWELSDGTVGGAWIGGGKPDGIMDFAKEFPIEDFCWQHPENPDGLVCGVPIHYHEIFNASGATLNNEVNFHVTDYYGLITEAGCTKYWFPAI